MRTHPLRAARGRLAAPLAFALALAVEAPSAAQPASPSERVATAQGLYESAAELIKAGKLAEACPKLEESQRLDPALGTQFFLATCYENTGRPTSAWSLFLQVAARAKAAGNVQRESTARTRAVALEPKLPRLAVVLPEEVAALPGITVMRDGSELKPVVWGTAVPVDFGEHTVRVTATGKAPWEVTMTVRDLGERREVKVPPLLDAAAPSAEPRADRAPGADDVEAPPPPGAPGRMPGQRVAALVVGGVGITGIAVGGVPHAAGVRRRRTRRERTGRHHGDGLHGRLCCGGGRHRGRADPLVHRAPGRLHGPPPLRAVRRRRRARHLRRGVVLMDRRGALALPALLALAGAAPACVSILGAHELPEGSGGATSSSSTTAESTSSSSSASSSGASSSSTSSSSTSSSTTSSSGTCVSPPQPPGGSCPGACTGGCAGGVCTIACTADQQCQGKSLTCPNNFACTVECGGLASCHMTTIKCPATYPCKVVCDAAQGQTCENVAVNCSPTGPCSLECGAGTQACAGAKMSCGSNSCHATCAGTDLPALTCGSSCSCHGC